MDFTAFTKIIDSSGEAASLLDLEKSSVFINRALRELLGYSDELNEIKDLFRIFADQEQYLLIYEKISNGASWSGDAELLKADNSALPFNLKADPVKENSKISGMIIFYTDISRQKRNENRLKLLSNLQMKLLRPSPLSEKMKYITDTVVTALNADLARIWLLKSKDLCNKGCMLSGDDIYPVYCVNNDSCLHLTASSGLYSNITGKRHRIPPGAGNIGMIAAGKADRVIIDNIQGNPDFEEREWLQESGLKSFAGYRLTDSENRCKGVLAFFSKESISPGMVSYSEAISHLTSQVIMNTDSEDELRDALELAERANTLMAGREVRIREMKVEVNSLCEELGKRKKYIETEIETDFIRDDDRSGSEIKDAVSNALSLAEDAEIARRETAELNEQILRIQQAVDSSSDAIAISTLGGEFFYINKTFTDFFGYTVSELAMCDVKELFSSEITGRAVLNNADSGSSWKGEAEIIKRNSSRIPVLLRVDPFISAEGEKLGLIWIFTDISERKFAEETMFQYAKTMERDLKEKKERLRKARYLQNSFIQNIIPSVREFSISTLFMPCEKLGGDFFRIARGNFDNKFVIIIGDCTGHGINASLDASLLASIAESNLSYLYEGNRTDLFLNKINSEFLKYADEDQFPTMFAAVIDLATKEMFYSNANSELPFLLSSSGISRLDPVRGIHIGYFEEGNYERKKVQLNPGDRLVFYSDAVIEIDRGEYRKTGYKWFKNVLAETGDSSKSTGKMFNSVIDRLMEENGQFPLKDDTTLIIIEYISCEIKNYKFRRYSECRSMYEEVKKQLEYLDYSEAEINQITISLDEICINAFNHGNKNNPEKSVEISADINCEDACFSVTDEGDGFSPDQIPDPVINLEKMLDEDLEEEYTHGRGIWITEKYMDSVVFSEKGNSVEIIKSKKNTMLRTN